MPKSSLEPKALEAGFHFMSWSFSLADKDANKPFSSSWQLEATLKRTLAELGLDAEAALAGREQVKPEQIKALLARRKAKTSAWFEVGYLAMFVCNMAATGAPPMLLDAALSGFDNTLQTLRPDAGGQVGRIIQRIRDLSGQNTGKETLLAGITGSLRGLANPAAPKAFLSHRSTDKPIVEHVALALEGLEVKVWYDSWSILPGDSLPGSIREALQSSEFIVFFASSQSLDAARAWIREELDRADAYRLEGRVHALLIVLLEDCRLQELYPHLRHIDAQGTKESERDCIETSRGD